MLKEDSRGESLNKLTIQLMNLSVNDIESEVST